LGFERLTGWTVVDSARIPETTVQFEEALSFFSQLGSFKQVRFRKRDVGEIEAARERLASLGAIS
jgi:hypothetical protein